MRKGFLIYEEMRKYLVIYEEAHSEILTYEKNLIFFFISVVHKKGKTRVHKDVGLCKCEKISQRTRPIVGHAVIIFCAKQQPVIFL